MLFLIALIPGQDGWEASHMVLSNLLSKAGPTIFSFFGICKWDSQIPMTVGLEMLQTQESGTQ